MSLYNDLTTVLTPYANKIKQNESDIGDIQDTLEHLDVETDKTLSIEGKPADANATGNAVAAIREEVEGQESSETLVEVTGVNFAENGTAYKSVAPYRTYYIPVTKGAKYIITIDNSSNPNAVETRYVFSADVPAVGVSGQYIGKSSTPRVNSSTYTYTATDDGYFGVAYWYSQYTTLSAKSISGGINQRLNIVEGMSGEVDDVNDRLDDISDTVSGFSGDTVQLENKTYWGGSSIGETTESRINIKSPADSGFAGAYVELPCGQTLRLVGAGVSSLTRLYFVFDANTEILIDVSDVSQNEKAELHYLSYEIDTHIYINCRLALLHEITVIEDITKPFGDEIASAYKMGTVLNLNGAEYVRHAVKSMRRAYYGGRVPAVFLHFSDIHGDVANLKRIIDFSNEPSLKSIFSDVICSGDIVPVSLTDGMTWYSSVSGSEKVLLIPGNHDSVYGSETSVTTATKQNVYEALIASRVDGWNVSQPNNASTEYLSYYFKDYTNPKLRVIFLDTNGHGDENYLANENTWLVSVLESAKTAGLSVVCVNHFIFANTGCSVVPCSFSPRVPQRNEGSWIIPSSFISSVEDFISGGGDFVCWLGGHGHQDHVLLHSNGHQLCIGVSLATYDKERSKFGDDQRIFGTKSQDLFNVIAVDTYSKHISILRVGCDLTRLMNSKRHLCIDYVNRTVVWND